MSSTIGYKPCGLGYKNIYDDDDEDDDDGDDDDGDDDNEYVRVY